MSVDWFANPSSAKTVQSIMFDVGGKDMYGMIAVSDWDEEIRDVAFIFLIPLWPLLLLVPVSKPFVIVHLPVLIGFFKASCICLTLCQIFCLLLEYFQLFIVAPSDFCILLHNSCQSLGNVEELLSARGFMSFKSSTHRSRGEG